MAIKLSKLKSGNYFCVINEQKVLLKTKNYMVARERALEAEATGKRDWSEEGETVKITAPDWSNQPPPVAENMTTDWTGDVARAAASAPPDTQAPPVAPPIAPITPDRIYPPALPPMTESAKPADPWETPTPPPSGETEAPKSGDSTYLPPEFFKNIIENCAAILTDLQLSGQEYLIARWLKANAGQIPYQGPKAISREAGKEIWTQALKEMFPDNIPLPPWLLAPIAIAALSLPVQLADASPMAKTEEPPKPAK